MAKYVIFTLGYITVVIAARAKSTEYCHIFGEPDNSVQQKVFLSEDEHKRNTIYREYITGITSQDRAMPKHIYNSIFRCFPAEGSPCCNPN